MKLNFSILFLLLVQAVFIVFERRIIEGDEDESCAFLHWNLSVFVGHHSGINNHPSLGQIIHNALIVSNKIKVF